MHSKGKLSAQRKETIVVKFGSNVSTCNQGRFDFEVMRHNIEQIAEVYREKFVIVVISGSVAIGKTHASQLRTHSRHHTETMHAAMGQHHLMFGCMALFDKHAILCGQVLLRRKDINENLRSHLLDYQTPGVIAVINENDAITTDKTRFNDNDHLAALIAQLMRAKLLLLLTNVDGLYDGDPKDERSKLITDIYPGQDCSSCMSNEKSPSGRGGMPHKINAAQFAARHHISTIISNGNNLTQRTIELAADGKPGRWTRFHALGE